MKILIQAGNLGYSILDHLIKPIASASEVEEVAIVCTNPGPANHKIKYMCPPIIIRKCTLLAFIYESFSLLVFSVFRKPNVVAGYLLFPHGVLAFLSSRITRSALVLSMIAGPVELHSMGSPLNVDLGRPLKLYGKALLHILKRADAVITTGSFTKRFLITHGVTESKIHPIISIPDHTSFHPAVISHKYDVIFVGRLAPVKHVETILHAISQVKINHSTIRLAIVGEGECRSSLERLAADLCILDNTVFLGFQKDIASYLNQSRVFVLTSEREGFPNVYLEALLCGLPSVVSNCGDITDIAKDGVNAFVIDKYDDYNGFARAIMNLLEDNELYEKMARNVLATAATLSPDNTTREWEKIIRERIADERK